MLGAVLCHRAACVSVEHSEEAPVGQLSTQLWHTVVEVLHVGPPALHAPQGVGEAPAGATLLCQLVQDRPVQVGAGDDLLLLPLPRLLPLCRSSTAPFEERADPLLRLFHQLPHKRRHLHRALPGCPHGSYAQRMWWESSFIPRPVLVAGTEGWDGPDRGPVQCLRSTAAPGLRAWLPQLMDVLSAGCSPPSPCSSPSSPLSSLETSLISALCHTHPSLSSLFGRSSVLLWFHLLPRFFIALYLFHRLSLALLFFPPCLRRDWLAICVHQSLPILHRRCHVWAQPLSLSSYLQLCPSHISGNLNLWSAWIMGCHCCGLQDCRPFSTQYATGCGEKKHWGKKAYFQRKHGWSL